jgi:hypothetical protein
MGELPGFLQEEGPSGPGLLSQSGNLQSDGQEPPGRNPSGGPEAVGPSALCIESVLERSGIGEELCLSGGAEGEAQGERLNQPASSEMLQARGAPPWLEIANVSGAGSIPGKARKVRSVVESPMRGGETFIRSTGIVLGEPAAPCPVTVIVPW